MDDHINFLCNTDEMPISRANLHRINFGYCGEVRQAVVQSPGQYFGPS
jgi:hypothetical protein